MAKSKKKAKRSVKKDKALDAGPLPVKKKTGTRIILIIAVVAVFAGLYFAVDYYTGWGNTEKVIKRNLEQAETYAVYKRYKSAIKTYEHVMSRWGNNEKYTEYLKQARLSLAKTYKDANEHIKAIELYKELAAEYKDKNNDLHAWLLLELGDSYNSIYSGEDAIKIYKEIIERFPDTDWSAEALFGIADAYKSMGDIDNALKYYRKIAGKYKKGFLSAEALTNIGKIYEDQEKYKKAMTTYKNVVDNFPEIVTEYARSRLKTLSGKKKSD